MSLPGPCASHLSRGMISQASAVYFDFIGSPKPSITVVRDYLMTLVFSYDYASYVLPAGAYYRRFCGNSVRVRWLLGICWDISGVNVFISLAISSLLPWGSTVVLVWLRSSWGGVESRFWGLTVADGNGAGCYMHVRFRVRSCSLFGIIVGSRRGRSRFLVSTHFRIGEFLAIDYQTVRAHPRIANVIRLRWRGVAWLGVVRSMHRLATMHGLIWISIRPTLKQAVDGRCVPSHCT